MPDRDPRTLLQDIYRTARHRFRTSFWATPYWKRRLRKLQAKGHFAQHREDLALLELIGPRGTYLDIGANHPFVISNTFLLYQQGWRGVTVEPIRSLWKMHRRWRPNDVALNCCVGEGDRVRFFELSSDALSTLSREVAEQISLRGNGTIMASYQVPMMTGRQIMDEYFADRELTLLSIDVEGAELEVLESFNLAERPPQFIIFEHASFIPNLAGAEAVGELLTRHGYRFLREIGCNLLFGRSSEVVQSNGAANV